MTWFSSVLAALRRGRLRRNAKARQRPNRFLPRLEMLETRELLATFLVTNVNNDGDGSLRRAIVNANTTAGMDTINFNIAGSGVQTIRLASALPDITDSVVIDGYTQPGASPNTLANGDNAVLRIELSGASAGAGIDGLTIRASNSTIRGLVINGFQQDAQGDGGAGIVLLGAGATNNRVVGNFIGTDPTGTGQRPNDFGVVVSTGASMNTIGGMDPGDRNLISANDVDGVELLDAGTNGNVVRSNIIGLDATGTQDLGNGDDGIFIANGASNNRIIGNLISGNGDDGIDISDAATSNNVVQGNSIGTDVTGTQDLGNDDNGIALDGSTNNLIGGTDPAARNVIGGNDGDGIQITDPEATGNVVQNNFIGTNAAGTAALANDDGVVIRQGANGNLVGGIDAGNLISGNDDDGLVIENAGSSNNRVQGNRIGTTVTGAALGNGDDGVFIQDGASNNQVLGNVIGASGDDGIDIEDPGTTGNVVQGNFIGTDSTGTRDLGNVEQGVELDRVSNNRVGGTGMGEGNVIAFNDQNGVFVVPDTDTAIGNAILGNRIFANDKLGIDLGATGVTATDLGDGVTANDPGDADTGGNNLQNYPVLTAVTSTASGSTITGTLNSTPNMTFRLEFFASPMGDPSGFGEGQTFLGFVTVTTDASGNASFTATGLAALPAGTTVVTATATNMASSDTSEFSADLAVSGGAAIGGSVAGLVFNDLDGDGTRDMGEAGVPGVRVFVDANGNGQFDASEQSVLTAADGSYTLSFAADGTFTIREVVPAGFRQTTANPAPVLVAGGQAVTGSNFGNQTVGTPPVSVAPAIESVAINDGGVQRSLVTSIQVTFNTTVNVDATAFTLRLKKGRGRFRSIGVNVTSAVVNGKTVATLTFSGRGASRGSLKDGKYFLAIVGDQLRNAAGQAVDADGNGTPGGTFQFRFARRFGDGDGNGRVTRSDKRLLRSTLGKTTNDGGFLAFFDFNRDGVVNGSDRQQFNRRFGPR